MKKLVSLLLAILLIIALVSCTENYETDFTKMEDLEKWISNEWELIEEFKIFTVKVDTIDSPKHDESIVLIDSSYLYNGDRIEKSFAFDITYDDFLILNKNNGYIVYNIENDKGDIFTDIDSKSLGVLKKVFEKNWRTLVEDSDDK